MKISACLVIILIALLISACGTSPGSDVDAVETQTIYIPDVSNSSETEEVYLPGLENASETEAVFIPGVNLPSTPEPLSPYLTFDGWSVYTSQDGSYVFSYPADAPLTIEGVVGFPTDEKPEGMSFDEFEAQLKEKYPGDLCVSIELGIGFLYIGLPDGDKYGPPCTVTGIGDFEIVNESEQVQVGSQIMEAQGYKVYDNQGGSETVFIYEFYHFTMPSGTRLTYGGNWTSQGKTYEEYLPDKEIILKIISSFQEKGMDQ